MSEVGIVLMLAEGCATRAPSFAPDQAVAETDSALDQEEFAAALEHCLNRGELGLSFEQPHPTSLIEDAARDQAVANADGFKLDKEFDRSSLSAIASPSTS